MKNLVLGNYVEHHELINIEFKEFCFKTNLFDLFCRHELRLFITNGRVLDNFNILILDNLKKYISLYVPRYMSAFHNCNHSERHYFYIGINDNSEITGIPFNGDLCKYNEYLSNCIQLTIDENVVNPCCMTFAIDICKNEIDTDILCSEYLDSVMCDYEIALNEYNRKYNEYVRLKKEWIKKMYFFKGKLENVINDEKIKMEFIEFLEKKNLLKSFPEVFWKYHMIISEDVKYVKKSPTELIYWFIKYKDEKVNELMTIKPSEPVIPKILNIEYCLLTQLSALRKNLVNQGLSYYTICITFKCKKYCRHKLTYMDQRSKEERTLTRIMDVLEQTPKCIDI